MIVAFDTHEVELSQEQIDALRNVLDFPEGVARLQLSTDLVNRLASVVQSEMLEVADRHAPNIETLAMLVRGYQNLPPAVQGLANAIQAMRPIGNMPPGNIVLLEAKN